MKENLMQKPAAKLLISGGMLCALVGCLNKSSSTESPFEKLGPYGKNMSTPEVPIDSLPTKWLKPMWPKISPNPQMDIFDTCGSGVLEDQKGFTPLPDGVTALKIISVGNYIASVKILDKDSIVIKEYSQQFGYCGELSNKNRRVPEGFVSYIGWDGRDKEKKLVDDKVLIWNIVMVFQNGSKEIKSASVENRR